ncbi:MAG: hypothetical protein O7C59_05235 [Rickettsia endosymbiont of Ixodes persulcatus]|nr:hypothetical protein [Rickettsia endosymbiont of Ixodes persulcatus]MCZ6902762.1 hypothetical protein [Rickettsia endosymbiont of Ixodes persulcatus]MCZ6909208.1 hypothetical protein [Rickettsia endosymbiont of Ixodes persulcatus]MCZ6910487.1 hypothetical protein [Rickettsia endosymbiont of Ixodes persulcatus]MCZ6913913.1 hypothetical protein [Rickettsia endosymbiont of Ixodes persulcatus]
MRKVIMQEPNVSNYTNTEELAILSGDDVIHHYLNTLHAPIELFINAHGQESAGKSTSSINYKLVFKRG